MSHELRLECDRLAGFAMKVSLAEMKVRLGHFTAEEALAEIRRLCEEEPFLRAYADAADAEMRKR